MMPMMPRVMRTSARVKAGFKRGKKSITFVYIKCGTEFGKSLLLNFISEKNLTGALFLPAPPPRKFKHSLLFHTLAPFKNKSLTFLL